jgi:shikimate dehydrogenase
MELYGLIGKKLTHSFSPAHFARKFSNLKLNADYRLYEIERISDFQKIIDENKQLRGLNVTIPYKKEIIPFLDTLDPVAKELSAVNTIKIHRQNDKIFLSGFNTDVIGFEESIKPLIHNRKSLSALILGTGGSAQSVAYVLRKIGVNYSFVSRTKKEEASFEYKDLNSETIEKNHLIINTTPLGMFPETENAPPIPYDFIGDHHILFDLIYNPTETLFLQLGKQKGALISNGQKMLEIQAEASWKIWQD